MKPNKEKLETIKAVKEQQIKTQQIVKK